MGMGRTRMMIRVQLPLALPAIMAGVRIATVSTISLTTVGGIIDYGGLGNLIFSGLQTSFRPQVLIARSSVWSWRSLPTCCCSACNACSRPGSGWPPDDSDECLGDVAAWLTDPENWTGAEGIPARTLEHLLLGGVSCSRWSSRCSARALARALRQGRSAGDQRRPTSAARCPVRRPRAARPSGARAGRPRRSSRSPLRLPPMLTNAYVGMREVDDTVEAPAAWA